MLIRRDIRRVELILGLAGLELTTMSLMKSWRRKKRMMKRRKMRSAADRASTKHDDTGKYGKCPIIGTTSRRRRVDFEFAYLLDVGLGCVRLFGFLHQKQHARPRMRQRRGAINLRIALPRRCHLSILRKAPSRQVSFFAVPRASSSDHLTGSVHEARGVARILHTRQMQLTGLTL